jgi:hypothetical protein
MGDGAEVVELRSPVLPPVTVHREKIRGSGNDITSSKMTSTSFATITTVRLYCHWDSKTDSSRIPMIQRCASLGQAPPWDFKTGKTVLKLPSWLLSLTQPRHPKSES